MPSKAPSVLKRLRTIRSLSPKKTKDEEVEESKPQGTEQPSINRRTALTRSVSHSFSNSSKSCSGWDCNSGVKRQWTSSRRHLIIQDDQQQDHDDDHRRQHLQAIRSLRKIEAIEECAKSKRFERSLQRTVSGKSLLSMLTSVYDSCMDPNSGSDEKSGNHRRAVRIASDNSTDEASVTSVPSLSSQSA